MIFPSVSPFAAPVVCRRCRWSWRLHNGLAMLVQGMLEQDPFSGHAARREPCPRSRARYDITRLVLCRRKQALAPTGGSSVRFAKAALL